MNNDIGFYVRKLDHQIRRGFHAKYNRKSMEECSLANIWIVDYLWANGGREISQKEIEERMCINRATASKMLKLMEEKELITRTSAASDGRQKCIALTERGKALQRLGQSVREEMEQELCSCLTPEETAEFKRLCEKLIDGLEARYAPGNAGDSDKALFERRFPKETRQKGVTKDE